MGYYTRYTLETNDPESPIDYGKELQRLTGASVPYIFEEPCTWYTHTSDLLKLSRAYPNVLFTLSGAGDDDGDLWREYYKAGKMQREEAVITYGPFDPKKLQ